MYIIEKTDITILFTATDYMDLHCNVPSAFDVVFPRAAKSTAEARRYTRHGAGLDAIEALVMGDAVTEGIPVADVGVTAMFVTADMASAIRRRLDKIADDCNASSEYSQLGQKARARAERAGLRCENDRWSVTENAIHIAYHKTALSLLAKRTLDRMNRLGVYATMVADKIERMRSDGSFERLPKRVQAKVAERLARAKAHAAAAAAFETSLTSEGIED